MENYVIFCLTLLRSLVCFHFSWLCIPGAVQRRLAHVNMWAHGEYRTVHAEGHSQMCLPLVSVYPVEGSCVYSTSDSNGTHTFMLSNDILPAMMYFVATVNKAK